MMALICRGSSGILIREVEPWQLAQEGKLSAAAAPNWAGCFRNLGMHEIPIAEGNFAENFILNRKKLKFESLSLARTSWFPSLFATYEMEQDERKHDFFDHELAGLHGRKAL